MKTWQVIEHMNGGGRRIIWVEAISRRDAKIKARETANIHRDSKLTASTKYHPCSK